MKKQKSKTWKTYKKEFFKNNKTAFFLAFVSTILISTVNLGLTWLMQIMIDSTSGIINNFSFLKLLIITLIFAILIILIKLLAYFAQPFFVKRAMSQYKNKIFSKLTQKSITSFNDESTSTYLSGLTSDATIIEQNYISNIFELIFDIFILFGSLALMLIYNPLFAAISIAFFTLPIAAAVVGTKRMKSIEITVSEKNKRFLASLKDTLSGFSIIKSFKTEESFEKIFNNNNNSLENAKCIRGRIIILLGMIGAISGFVAQFGAFLAGIYLISIGVSITPGILIIFLDLTSNVINPIKKLPEHFAKRSAALALIDKLQLSLEQNSEEAKSNIIESFDDKISIKNLSFGYDENNNVLKNISTCFYKGRSYAIVGSSGSGKSTLLALLMGVYSSYTGEICYDSFELRTLNIASLYNIVSIIEQNVFIFNDTIKNNITLFRKFESSDIENAVFMSGLEALTKKQGYSYPCGENGNNLSGGEKQRISIARSLLRKTPVLLVDEATSALDKETARHVTESILSLEGFTKIVITHSLDESLLKKYDEIIVMKDGHIAEKGDFDTLNKNKSVFYSLYISA